MTIDDQRIQDALRRNHFDAFARWAFGIVHPGIKLVWNWHLDAICHQLERVERGECRRLAIEIQPRSLKSFLTSVAYPAWLFGRMPSQRMITASYSQILANQHCTECRMLMRHPDYQRLFPSTRIGAKDTESEFTTTGRGARIATSPAGTLTGRGGQLIILDDIQKADEALSQASRKNVVDWYRNTLFSRLDNKLDGAIIVVMQRLHLDNLLGHLRTQGGWDILSLPATAEEDSIIALPRGQHHHRRTGDLLQSIREPQSVLDETKREIGSYNYSAQYQQRPIPEQGAIIRWEWFETYDEVPYDPRQIVQSWDVAMKAEDSSDYSVCTTWAIVGDRYYLINIYREQLSFPALLQSVKELARHYRTDVLLIEDKASGTALIQQLGSGGIGIP